MTTRLTRLPKGARIAGDGNPGPSRAQRRPPAVGQFRCAGTNGCGHVTDGTYASAERHADSHADSHGGARIDVILPEVTP